MGRITTLCVIPIQTASPFQPRTVNTHSERQAYCSEREHGGQSCPWLLQNLPAEPGWRAPAFNCALSTHTRAALWSRCREYVVLNIGSGIRGFDDKKSYVNCKTEQTHHTSHQHQGKKRSFTRTLSVICNCVNWCKWTVIFSICDMRLVVWLDLSVWQILSIWSRLLWEQNQQLKFPETTFWTQEHWAPFLLGAGLQRLNGWRTKQVHF